MKTKAAYSQFWSKAFAVSTKSLCESDIQLSSSGAYLERSKDLIYFFEDLLSGKRVLAAHEQELKRIAELSSISELKSENVVSRLGVDESKLVHRDTDLYLPESAEFVAPEDHRVIRLSVADLEQIDQFFSSCSEDDVDTLDLDIEKDHAVGIIADNKIAGIARFNILKNAPALADMTAVIGSGFRGMRLARPLVSRLVQDILEQGLIPRYRVEDGNGASIALARSLGFRPVHRLLVWIV